MLSYILSDSVLLGSIVGIGIMIIMAAYFVYYFLSHIANDK